MAENVDEDEVRYLSSNSVVDNYGGEDLCERAQIYRRNHFEETSVPLNDYNEGFVEMMVKKDTSDADNNFGVFEINSIIESLMDVKANDSDGSPDRQTDDDIEELVDDSEISVKWTPNVFIRPIEKEFVESVMDLNESMYSCLAFHSIQVESYDSYQKAFSFYKSFLERLKRLKCRDFRLELFLWPKIIKQISISCVSSPKSGKTNSYLIPLMNWFDSKEIQREKDTVVIGAVVICSSARQTYDIARLAKQWRDPNVPPMEQTVRIVSMNSTNEKKQMTAILNGCDILITTPEPLLRAIQSSIIDCTTTKALIIDEADVTLALHMKTIREIYLFYAKIKKNNKRFIQKNGTVSNPMAFQTMIFSQKWTHDVQWFSREVQHMPSFVFGSFYEILIALKVECRVELIESEKCREKAIKTLTKKAINDKHRRIAIVCRDNVEISFLKRHMKEEVDSVISTIVVTHEDPHYELEAKRNKWNKLGGLLFITEEAIKITSGFQSCYCIIHYRLPHNFSPEFGDRFRLMTKQFKKCKESPFDTRHLPHLVNYVVVSPTDNHIPEIIAYLNRLEVPIPPKLLLISDYERRPLCVNFASFAKCPLGSVYCPDRHEFNETDRPLSGLPVNGQIKIVVTYVMGANQFYFRLQEFRNKEQSSGKWQKRDIIYDDIKPQLSELKDQAFNTVKEVCTERVYGIAIRGEVLRVRVLRLLGVEELQFYEEYDPNDKSQKVELFCIDFGHKLRSRSRQLFELPENLRSLPSFAFKAYLFGIKPIDNEIEWDFRATQRFYDLVENYKITRITAWVLKQMDGVFWLNRMHVENRLKNAKLKLEWDPMTKLIESRFVQQNENKLKDVNTDYNHIINIWYNYRLNNVVYHSCLVDDSTYVVVSDFVSLNQLYVIQESRIKTLEELEDKWLSFSSTLQPLTEVSDNQNCFFKGTDATTKQVYINRAKVVAINGNAVDVFLVDHGETITNINREKLFNIKEEHLTVLPFQAIKIAIFGVKEVKPISYDLICELTRDKSDRYLTSIAHKQSFDNGVHTVRLFVAQDGNNTHFVALSKILVNMGYAEYTDNEEDNEFDMIVEKEVEDPYEECESEYMEELEDYMADKLAKDVLRQMGLDPDEPPPRQTKPIEESRASKTLRRIKAITAKRNGFQKKEESSDESDDESKPIRKKIIQNSGEFDYEVDPNAQPLCYDPMDDFNDDCDFSDEDGILAEEELS